MSGSSDSDDSDQEFELQHMRNSRSLLVIISLILVAILTHLSDGAPVQVYDPTLRIDRNNLGQDNVAYLQTRYNWQLAYRMEPEELIQLADYLLPGIERHTSERDRYNNLEAMAIVVRRLAFPSRRTDLSREFGRSFPVLNRSYIATMTELDQQWGNLLRCNPAHFQGQLRNIKFSQGLRTRLRETTRPQNKDHSPRLRQSHCRRKF